MAAKVYGIGVSDIQLKIEGAGVGSPFESLATIGEVAEGSAQFTQETPTETKFKGDYGDTTIFTLFQMGDVMFEADIVEVDGAKWAALTGGTWTSGTKTISLPTSVPLIYGQLKMTMDNGLESINIVRGQVVANLVGQNVKTEMFKIHIKVTAVPDADGYVEIKTK